MTARRLARVLSGVGAGLLLALGGASFVAHDARARGDGSVSSGGGARVHVPNGALAKPSPIRVAPAGRKEIESFTFQPAGLAFRVPVAIELPHVERNGEIECRSSQGAQRHEPFSDVPPARRLRILVMELPSRCAVRPMSRARARGEADSRPREQMKELEEQRDWKPENGACDPRVLTRPNSAHGLHEAPGVDGCPPSMAPIPTKGSKAGGGVCIDRWEAYTVEVLDDGKEESWSPFFNPGDLRLRAKSAPSAVPQAYISKEQASDACRASGKRLCSADEWTAACRGSGGKTYPYGDRRRPGTCNDHRAVNPAVRYFQEHDRSVFSELDHPCIDQLPDSLLPAGSKPECKSDDGTFDMVGNLHEWTSDGAFRGGFYADTTNNGPGCEYVTTAHEPTYWDYSIGFRCCAPRPRK